MNLKVNLLLAGQALNGFMNIDPLSNPQDNSKIAANLDNLDSLIDHNSVELLLAMDVLDYYPLQGRPTILNNWLCKLAHGGKIVVSGLDIREVGRWIYYQQGDLHREGNLLLYGPADHVLRLRKSMVTIDDVIVNIMRTNQFSIQSKRFEGLQYIVEAQRN